MYKSPIDLFCDHVVTEQENEVFKAVVRCGIDVDKDELIKALAYDRRQYDLGYADGKMDANAELIRRKDCKHWNGDDDDTFCSELGIFGTGPNSFCSYARKKETPTMEEFMQGQDLGDPEDGRL